MTHPDFESAARAAGCVTLAIPRRMGARVEWVEALARSGDFAVTPADRSYTQRSHPARKWVVTHVPTGLKLPGPAVTAKVALTALEALAHVPCGNVVQLQEQAEVIRSVAVRILGSAPQGKPMPDHSAHFVELP